MNELRPFVGNFALWVSVFFVNYSYLFFCVKTCCFFLRMNDEIFMIYLCMVCALGFHFKIK